MISRYKKLNQLAKAANISLTELAQMLGYKSQQSYARSRGREAQANKTLCTLIKLSQVIDDLDWSICNGCNTAYQNSELVGNPEDEEVFHCPNCNTIII